jgi:AraC family transcriptional regulator, regulatory protein of adaptative response / methylated-DNA-[protein]-cysteine methyltransferase
MPDDLHTPRDSTALDDRRWDALLARDPDPACGPFLYAVTTQGVYCRPGCPSRPPLRRNTRFFADAAAAEAAGFRACKRCDPKGNRAALHAEAIKAACGLIEASETPPPLSTLAARAGYARHHFLRLFKEVTGLTPGAYADAVRARRLGASLAAGDRVAEAVAGAGYGSESRVYSAPGQVLGMTPGTARRGGEGEVIRLASAESPLGAVLVGATEKGVCFIGFAENPEEAEANLRQRFPKARIEAAEAELAETVRQVVGFIEEPHAALALPLDLRGTAFQRRVWQALQAIPFGETRSYAAVAEAIGAPRAVRAVATACANNKLALAVPCHRVVASDGGLAGYRWGLDRKRALLAKEKAGRETEPA